MNISAPFIRRPIGTSLLAAALLIAGILAFNFLPVAPLPQVEFPVISVNAGLPGASPETMASAVATPLERQFGRIAGINQMTSTSQLGSTNIVLQFDLNRNIDAAGRDVQAAINAARSQLPANLPGNPSYRKVNPADAPILILALYILMGKRERIHEKALGTALGTVTALPVAIVGLPAWAISVLAAVAFVLALWQYHSYWLYYAFLTFAIILALSPPGHLGTEAAHRGSEILAGIAILVVALAIMHALGTWLSQHYPQPELADSDAQS